MADIDLIYDADCPNAGQARIKLKQALEMAGLAARWREWIRTAPSTPQHLRRFGSPTILVDGRDVAGREGLDGSGACRIYPGEDLRRHGAPAVSMILTALRAPRHRTLSALLRSCSTRRIMSRLTPGQARSSFPSVKSPDKPVMYA